MPKTLAELSLPAELRYTSEHIWIRADGDQFVAGVSDYAQDQLGEVVYIELPSEGDFFNAGDEFGEVESLKSVNKLFMPVSGKITAVNTKLDDSPSLLNADCYNEGWIIKFNPQDKDALTNLLSAEAYRGVLN